MSDEKTFNNIYLPTTVVFPEIDAILLENNIKEDPFDSDINSESSYIGAIFSLTKSLLHEDISEEKFCASLAERCKTTNDVAQNILKRVKEKVFPLAQKIDLNENIADELDDTENNPVMNSQEAGGTNSPSALVKKVEKPTTKKDDSYREPIT